jgi:hypothetical protein
MNRYFTLSIFTAGLLFYSGCGEDRSTLYDSNGQKIAPSGKQVWIYETRDGREMVANNYVYIPGGFDVDGDGIDESGFWLAKFEARESNETITGLNMLNVRDVIRNNFLVYNPETKLFDSQLDINDTTYKTEALSSILNFHANRVSFTDEGNATGSYSPIEAVIAMEYSQVKDSPWHVSLPTEKQWMQVVKLVINNQANWTSGEIGKGKLYQGKKFDAQDRRYFVIQNNVLGEDLYVPKNYRVRVYDLAGNLAEWTKGMFSIENRFLGGAAGMVEYNMLGSDTPRWWLPILEGENAPLHSLYGIGKYFDGSNTSGATDTLNLIGVTGDVDPYAVVCRGGSASKGDEELVGISAAKLNYGPGFKDPAIGFRGASEYIE